MPLTGCGGGDISPMNSSSSARTTSAPGSFFTAGLEQADPDIAAAIRGELGRQRHEIELIASENIVSRAVLEAQGSVLTNKYAEGYPGNRYYGGCEWVDVVETLAIDRAKKLFGAQFANVQPNSGSQMNQAVFLALLQPGDTFMGLDLAAGGHLTHGSPVNMSGKWFKASHYTVRREDQIIDMDAVARQAEQVKPKLIMRCRSPRHCVRISRSTPRTWSRTRGRWRKRCAPTVLTSCRAAPTTISCWSISGRRG